MSVKDTLKNFVPDSIWSHTSQLYRVWRQEIIWRLNYKSWISANRIKSFQNRHEGKRCFIIGNGPSLNNMDLTLLQKEYTFGMNRIYLLFPKIGFSTTYYVSVNQLVIGQFANEISKLSMPKFLSRRKHEGVQFSKTTMYLHPRAGLKFSKKPQYYIYEGATVTYVAMQLAFYMGFEKVILIGVDHNFYTKGKPNKEISSTGDDPNHFAPNYFGKSVRWQLPDLHTSEKAYVIAREAFAGEDRSIVDATVGGLLTIYPKVRYDTLF